MTWLLDLVPWWAWLALAIAAIGALWLRFGWQGALIAAAAVLPILGLRWARAEGAKDERSKRDREALDHVRIRKETDDDVAELGSQEVDERLARWNRDE